MKFIWFPIFIEKGTKDSNRIFQVNLKHIRVNVVNVGCFVEQSLKSLQKQSLIYSIYILHNPLDLCKMKTRSKPIAILILETAYIVPLFTRFLVIGLFRLQPYRPHNKEMSVSLKTLTPNIDCLHRRLIIRWSIWLINLPSGYFQVNLWML